MGKLTRRKKGVEGLALTEKVSTNQAEHNSGRSDPASG